MSAPSGIKVPASLASAFSAAVNDSDDTRALVFVIEGESFSHLTTIKPKSTFKEDMSLLGPALPSPKTPASFAYRLDSKEGGKYEWMMITFVPDTAGVRAKMLQASSRAGLLKALGGGNFKHDWFTNSINDLTPSALSAHLTHLASPAPLSASEKALAEIREAEAAEAKRAAMDPENERRRINAVVGLGGKMRWDGDVEGAMRKVAERSDEGWIVVLEIPAKDTGSVTLFTSSSCTPSQLASKLPPKSPAYVFYSFPTPAPPPASPTPTKTWKSSAGAPGNTFQASEGGRRTVATTWKPADASEKSEDAVTGEEKKETAEKDGKEGHGDQVAADVKELSIDQQSSEGSGNKEDEAISASPKEEKADAEPVPAAPTPAPPSKGRVIFIYSCPSGSPVKLRMVYSTSVRGVQQDAADKAGVEIVAKASQQLRVRASLTGPQLETSDISDLTESHLRSALPTSKPKHSSSLPTPSSNTAAQSSTPQPAFGAPAPAFGGAFGRPRPITKKQDSVSSISTASAVPLPSSDPSSPVVQGLGAASAARSGEDEEDSKESIKRAFDAFGPRVGAGGGGGGFARPKPAGRR